MHILYSHPSNHHIGSVTTSMKYVSNVCWNLIHLPNISKLSRWEKNTRQLIRTTICRSNDCLCSQIMVLKFFFSFSKHFIRLLFCAESIPVVGGWANNRTLIRRKRQDYDMTVEYNFNVLRKDDPLKMLIEISNGKNIAALSAKQIRPFCAVPSFFFLLVSLYFRFVRHVD